jgi:hypothetical protein
MVLWWYEELIMVAILLISVRTLLDF